MKNLHKSFARRALAMVLAIAMMVGSLASLGVTLVLPASAAEIPVNPVWIQNSSDFAMNGAAGWWSDIQATQNDTYDTYTAVGNDPNFYFCRDNANQAYARYAVVKYRTDKADADMQIYMKSDAAGPSNDEEMLQVSLTGDGQWHLAIFDLKTLEERGKLNGSTTGYIRLDPLQPREGGSVVGASIDIEYFAFFNSIEEANAYEYGVETYAPESGKGFEDAAALYKGIKTLTAAPNTVEAWVKLDANDYVPSNSDKRSGVIYGNYESGCKNALSIEFFNGAPRVYACDANTYPIINYTFPNINILNGEWTHVAVVFNSAADEMYCYINGELKGTASMNGYAFPAPDYKPMAVGGDLRSGNSQNFKGEMASLTVYSDMRTADEIAEDMSTVIGAPAKDGLLAAYDLTKGAGEDIYDISGNGYHATKGADDVVSVDPTYIWKSENFEMSTAAGWTSGVQAAQNGAYDTYSAVGEDPCYFYCRDNANQAYARYAVVKYRTAKADADMQLYMKSDAAGPSNNEEMLQISLTGDNEWHLAFFDLSELETRDKLNGSTTGYVRLDPLEPRAGGSVNGASIDIEYFAFFGSEAQAMAYEAALNPPETETEAPETETDAPGEPADPVNPYENVTDVNLSKDGATPGYGNTGAIFGKVLQIPEGRRMKQLSFQTNYNGKVSYAIYAYDGSSVETSVAGEAIYSGTASCSDWGTTTVSVPVDVIVNGTVVIEFVVTEGGASPRLDSSVVNTDIVVKSYISNGSEARYNRAWNADMQLADWVVEDPTPDPEPEPDPEPTPVPATPESGMTFDTTLFHGIKNLTAAPNTIEAWVKVSTADRTGVIYGNYSSANPLSYAVSLEIFNGGVPRFYYLNENGEVHDIKFDQVHVNTGEWVHLAVTYESGSLKCYVNGELKQTQGLASFVVPTHAPMAVGGDLRTGNGQNFKGQIAAVTIYSDARTADEIVADMCTKIGTPATDGLLAAYDLTTAPTGEDIFDLSGNGYHVTKGSDNIVDEPETEAPETEAPETEAPETEAPETEAPETEAPETEAPETETEAETEPTPVPATPASGMTFDTTLFHGIKNLTDAPNTIEAWIKVSTAARTGVIYGNYSSIVTPDLSVSLEIHENGIPRFYYTDANAMVHDIRFDAVNVNTGEWLHLAVTYEAGELKCYVNGELKQTKSLGSFAVPVHAPMAVGGDLRNGNSQNFKGQIAAVTIYSDARTADEIVADMCTEIGAPATDGLLSAYDLTTVPSGEDIFDLSGNGYHITKGSDNIVEEPETDAPETEAPETEAPETEAPETEPETDAPETEPETEPETDAPVVLDPADVPGVSFNNNLKYEDKVNKVGDVSAVLKKGFVRFTTTGENPWLSVKTRVKAGDYPYMAIRYRISGDSVGNIYLSDTKVSPVFSAKAGTFAAPGYIADGEWHTAIFYITEDFAAMDGASLTAVRIPGAAEGYLDLAYVAFFATEAQAEAFEGYPSNDYVPEAGMSFTSELYHGIKTLTDAPNTIEAWIKVSTAARTGAIYGNYSSAIPPYRSVVLEIHENGVPRFYYTCSDGVNHDIRFSNVHVNTGEWVHLAVTYDAAANLLHCYVNGELAQTVNPTTEAAHKNMTSFEVPDHAPMAVGGDLRNGNGQYFKGQIASVTVYSDLRTEREIFADSMLAPGAVATDNLLAAYDLTGYAAGAPEDILDKSGNGYHITKGADNEVDDGTSIKPVKIWESKDFAMNEAGGWWSGILATQNGDYDIYTSVGEDPHFFYCRDNANQKYARYAVVKYRTNKADADMQIYMKSDAAGPSNDQEMLQISLTGDGEWHLAIFDLKTLEDRGMLNGSTTGYVRLDVLQPRAGGSVNGASIDIAYFAFFDSVEKAEAYDAAKGDPKEPEAETDAPETETDAPGEPAPVPATPESGMSFTKEQLHHGIKKLESMPLTIESWIKLDSTDYVTDGAGQKRYGVIYGNFKSDGAHALSIEFYNGAPRVYITNATGGTYLDHKFTTNVANGEWTHVAIAFNVAANEMYCYVNGELKETASMQGKTLTIPNDPMAVGGDLRTLNGVVNEHFFKGELAALTVYSDLRTADEIVADMCTEIGSPATDDLLCAYDLTTAPSGEDILDLSGNGYHVTKGSDNIVDEPETDAPETDAPETETDAPETETDAPETETDAPETGAPVEPTLKYEASDMVEIEMMGDVPHNCIDDTRKGDYNTYFVPEGITTNDPHFYLFHKAYAGEENVTYGSRYVVIKYRTATDGLTMQIFMGANGEFPENNDNRVQGKMTGDGQWHLLILDTQEISAEMLDHAGLVTNFIRFDVMANQDAEDKAQLIPDGASVDVAYVAFFESAEAAEAYDALRGDPREPAPDEDETGTPGEDETGTPGEDETGTPGEDETGTPGEDETGTPGEDETGTPGEDETGTPGEDETGTPSEDETNEPNKDDPVEDVTKDEQGTTAPEADTATDGTTASTDGESDADVEDNGGCGSGCGSSVSFGFVTVMGALAAAVALRKKKED